MAGSDLLTPVQLQCQIPALEIQGLALRYMARHLIVHTSSLQHLPGTSPQQVRHQGPLLIQATSG